jgi:ribonucleoside-triphosphate reductase (formate)
MNIIKRSGKIEVLSKKKIFDSICNANGCVKEDEKLTQKQIKRIVESVYSFCENLEEPIEIDILEDVIEKKLMEASGYEVAKRYITYRYEKERVRMNKSLTEKLTASNVQNQNANMDEFSFGGRIGEAAGYITKQYALDHLISNKTKKNHINNEIYIHDLDNYAVGSHNCLSIPFDKLLKEGFKTRQADVRPASSINTAMQLVAVIFQLQSLQQFGGVSSTHLDLSMVPFIRKSFIKHFKDGLRYIEGLSEDDIKKFEEELSKLEESE